MFPIKSNILLLHGFAESLQGGRAENQDDWAYLDTPLGFLLVLCDGMGGGPGGKTASYIAKYEIAQAVMDCNKQTPRQQALKVAFGRAQEALSRKMDEMPALVGMGATVVAILINERSAIVAHVGDSRCYRFSGSHMAFRTQDHSLVGELVRKKALTEEQARTSPQSNIISRGLGGVSNNIPEITEIPYRKGDRFVLCTDGVWGSMPHKILLQKLTAKNSCEAIVQNLSSEIDSLGNAHGGYHDNHTLAIIEMGKNSEMNDWRWVAGISGLIVAILVTIAMITTLSVKIINDSKWLSDILMREKKDETVLSAKKNDEPSSIEIIINDEYDNDEIQEDSFDLKRDTIYNSREDSLSLPIGQREDTMIELKIDSILMGLDSIVAQQIFRNQEEMNNKKEYKRILYNEIRRKIRVLVDSCDEKYKNEVDTIYDLFVKSQSVITGSEKIIEDSKIMITAKKNAIEKVNTIKIRIANLKDRIFGK